MNSLELLFDHRKLPCTPSTWIFFSSINLFSLLRDREIGVVGTVRSNSGGFPKSLAIREKNHKLDWNKIGGELCDGGKVLAITLIDSGPVQMLTTVNTVDKDDYVMRNRRRPRLTSTNGILVRSVFWV